MWGEKNQGKSEIVLEKLCNRDVWNSHGFFIWFVKCITKDLKSIFKDVEICNQFLRMPKKTLMVWNARDRYLLGTLNLWF